jgi:hypothetical protein
MKLYLVLANLVALSTLLSSCGLMRTGPSDDVIWKGVVMVLDPSSESGKAPDLSALGVAKQKYTIERNGQGRAVANDAAQSTECLPRELRQAGKPVEGQSSLIRVISKSNQKEVATLDFTQWAGTKEWWVHKIGERSECYLIRED